MGGSMFSDEQEITFVSRKGCMFNGGYYSADGTEILYGDLTDGQGISRFVQGIFAYRKKQQMFNLAYRYDYFKDRDISLLVHKR